MHRRIAGVDGVAASPQPCHEDLAGDLVGDLLAVHPERESHGAARLLDGPHPKLEDFFAFNLLRFAHDPLLPFLTQEPGDLGRRLLSRGNTLIGVLSIVDLGGVIRPTDPRILRLGRLDL